MYSAEYLYGKGKQTIDKYPKSTVCMFKITNLEEINKEICREAGNKTLVEVSNIVKSSISSEYVYVRYMGPKFAIAFSGIDLDAVVSFMKDIQSKVEAIEVEPIDVNATEETTAETEVTENAKPEINIVLSTYYKGTALEGLTKKLEEYLDNAPKGEHTISYL